MANDELLKLTWNGHTGTFLTIFEALRLKAKYTDVTLACEGKLFPVHRLVLASCSQFFDTIFDTTPADSTVIVLNEAKQGDIQSLIEYMYSGQVDVPQSQLTSFLNTATALQIKGLVKEAEYGEPQERMKLSEQNIYEHEVQPYKKRKSELMPPIDEASHVINLPSPQPKIRKQPEVSSSALNHCQSPIEEVISTDHWSQFQRSDLPNTTWSTSAKERASPQETQGNKIVTGHLHPTIEKTLHRVPETGEVKAGMKSERRFNHEDEVYIDSSMDFKIEVKDEADGCEDQDLNNGPEYAGSPEIYEQHDSYPDPYEGQGAPPFDGQSPNMSPHPPRTLASAMSVSTKFGAEHISGAPSVWNSNIMEANGSPGRSNSNQSTVSPKLLPFAKCSNCHTDNTKLWRRNMKGEIVCNACGLYFKLHGINRPPHLFRSTPMTRRRNPRKKKRIYEEILDSSEQPTNNEEINDSCYNDGGCDSDTQEGLAVLNAALTLNSLFAKAKQEAATKNSNSARFEQSPNSSPVFVASPSATTDGGRHPPPLLKLPMRPPPAPLTSSANPSSQ